MAEMNEAQARAACEAAKKTHEAAINRLRTDQLEFQLAYEDRDRANSRFYRADEAKKKSAAACDQADLMAREAFIALGRAQIASRGSVG